MGASCMDNNAREVQRRIRLEDIVKNPVSDYGTQELKEYFDLEFDDPISMVGEYEQGFRTKFGITGENISLNHESYNEELSELSNQYAWMKAGITHGYEQPINAARAQLYYMRSKNMHLNQSKEWFTQVLKDEYVFWKAYSERFIQ